MMWNIKSKSKDDLENLINSLKPFEILPIKVDYIFLKIKKDNHIITFYSNLTLTIENKKFEIDQDIKNKIIENILDKKMYVGSDEVGIGESIGPIIVCGASFKNLKQKEYYLFQKIIDSKELSYKEVKKIGFKLKNDIWFKCSNISVANFNKQYKENKLNIKIINAVLHNNVHLSLDFTKNTKVIDEFVDKKVFFNYLELTNQKIINKNNVIFEPKAEKKYLEVAAASILAKYFFNEYIEEILKENNIDINNYINRNINYNQIANDIKNKKIVINDHNKLIKNW